MSVSCLKDNFTLRVSSVLNNNAKEYGKKFLTDGNADTCWNSEQGTPQWIQVEFSNDVAFDELQLQFQGGFAGKDCCVHVKTETGMGQLGFFYPEDVNSLQAFSFPSTTTSSIKVVFNNSTDLFGRITVYKFDIRTKL